LSCIDRGKTDGIIYDIGAGNNANSPNDEVLSTNVNSIPRVGYYTSDIDFTGLSGWQFQAGTQGNQVSQAEWQSSLYDQDASSNFGASPSVSISTPTPSAEIYGTSSAVDATTTPNNGGSISNTTQLVGTSYRCHR